MLNSGILNGTAATSQASQTMTSGQKLVGSNFASFLKMLTTQMTNQNPMSPMSTQEFTTQLVQFSQVEQLMNMSRSVERGVSVQESTNLLSAASLTGSTVSVRSSTAEIAAGKAEFEIDVPAGTNALKAVITDASGTILARSDLAQGVGKRSIALTPKFPSGAPLPDGVYGLRVSGRNAAGLDIAVPTTANVKVSGIERGKTGVTLMTSSGSVALQDVIAIR